MSSLIYANANSLFDYSNGASRSLLLLLETWAAAGIKVYAITSRAIAKKGMSLVLTFGDPSKAAMKP